MLLFKKASGQLKNNTWTTLDLVRKLIGYFSIVFFRLLTKLAINFHTNPFFVTKVVCS